MIFVHVVFFVGGGGGGGGWVCVWQEHLWEVVVVPFLGQACQVWKCACNLFAECYCASTTPHNKKFSFLVNKHVVRSYARTICIYLHIDVHTGRLLSPNEAVFNWNKLARVACWRSAEHKVKWLSIICASVYMVADCMDCQKAAYTYSTNNSARL